LTNATNSTAQYQLNTSSLVGPVLIYLAIIVYGSLLPFHWNGLSLSAAWANFQHIPLLKLGVASRADLVANLLLYIPFGLLLCGWLVGENRQPRLMSIGMLLSLLLSLTVALGVEFIQQFFAPRTVSLNDIFAELAGAILGIALWPVIGKHLTRLPQTIANGGTQAREGILIAYALLYAVLSLFPYDFLLSFDEWRDKLASGAAGWVFAPNCGEKCFLRLIPEALLAAPLGALIFRHPRQHHLLSLLLSAAITGAILGVLIESLQLTIASGISQGASVISRAAGLALGAGLIPITRSRDWLALRQYINPILGLGILPYLGALAWLNGWFSGDRLGVSEGLERLGDIHFAPFYYHYFTTETVALASLLFQAALYLPIGAGLWIWQWSSFRSEWQQDHQRRTVVAGLVAGIVACIIEAGKLFITAKHPDPTNILIAVAAAMGAYRVLHALSTPQPDTPASSARFKPEEIASRHYLTPILEKFTEIPRAEQLLSKERPHWTVAAGVLAIVFATWAAITTPLSTGWVFLSLIVYATLIWRQPGLWLVWVPALLPLLDLTHWTGRLFWTEFDTVLLVTLGVAYLRLGSRLPPQRSLRRFGRLLFFLFVLSAAISFVIGLFPLATLDHNAFSSYISSYNALRAVKGLLFVLAFMPLLALQWEEPLRAANRLALGMTLGLAGTVAYVLWERATFPGLFNFENDYRITGPFPGMHVGGAYIEAFLTATLPFVALLAWEQRRAWVTVLAVGLYGLGGYSVMVTFSRGGQAAFALASLVLLLGFLKLAAHGRSHRFSNMIAVIVIVGVATVITWPIFSGQYSQTRWATAERDLEARTTHWADAISVVQRQNASLFGMGLGSFPSAYFWNSNSPSRPATYGFVNENGNSLLRLGSGDPLYFEQTVAVVAEQWYTLSMDLRAKAGNPTLIATVCEKAMLYSYTCVSVPLQGNAGDRDWSHFEMQIHAKNFGPPGSRLPRPVKLSFYNSRPGTLVDVDNVTLLDISGKNLVRNGDFSDGMHHWFFSTDDYLPWHVENLYLSIFFEQGWLGLLCFLALIVYAIVRWLPRAWRNDPLSLVLCASLTAFLAVGVLNSWGDEPRLSFLFYLLLIAGLIAEAPFVQTRQHSVMIRNSS
jgi:VanZ family protein/O-antigen ligase